MQKITLEGEVCGYRKKTLAAFIILLLVSGIMFYAGAKYEKRKLASLGLLKDKKTSNSEKKAKSKKQTTKETPVITTTPTIEQNATTPSPVTTPNSKTTPLPATNATP